MKIMKKVIGFLTMVIMVLAFTKPVKAQANIDVNANVMSTISITQMQGIDFGDIVGGSVYTINASDMQSADVLIEGDKGASVVVDVAQTTTLSNTANTDQMTFTTQSLLYNNANGNQVQDRSTASALNNGGTFDLNNSDGESRLYIGGSLDATNNPSAGQYNGQITVNVSYN